MKRRIPTTPPELSVLVVLVSMLALLVGCTSSPTPTTPPAAFDYLVRVRDPSGASLRNAKVIIEVPGRAPLDDFTDVNGLAVIQIPATYVDASGKLIVEAPGFEIYLQNLTLQVGQLPDEVRLSLATTPSAPTHAAATVPDTPNPAEPATPTSTPTLEPTSTATSSATPTETPTLAPRARVSARDLNVRAGPDTSHPVLTVAAQGDTFDIMGKNEPTPTWWQISAAGQPAWISASLVNTEGAIENVPVVITPSLPAPTNTPTRSFAVLYEWPDGEGWECWDVRVDLTTGKKYGDTFRSELNPAQLVVDFSSAAEFKGMVMYNGQNTRSDGSTCGDLLIPESALIEADVRLLDTGASARAEVFMQTSGFSDWFAGRPIVDTSDGSWRTLRPNAWVTGLPPVPISRQDKETFVTLGIEFSVDGVLPANPVRFAISRVRVLQP